MHNVGAISMLSGNGNISGSAVLILIIVDYITQNAIWPLSDSLEASSGATKCFILLISLPKTCKYTVMYKIGRGNCLNGNPVKQIYFENYFPL